MSRIVTILALACVLLALAGTAQAQTFGPTGTGVVSVTVGPEASISIDTATATLTEGANAFSPYGGTTNFTYKIRTGSTGSIVLKVANFTGGAVVPPVANLSYTCTLAKTSGTCAGGQTASNSDTPLVGFTSNAHSAIGGDGGTVSWTLINDPAYSVGTLTATVTYTISAT
jgi:hypothetical protein